MEEPSGSREVDKAALNELIDMCYDRSWSVPCKIRIFLEGLYEEHYEA